MGKIGRNEPCLCGSGKKYKRCHGAPERQEYDRQMHEVMITRAEAMRVQRERQQGLGNPIVSGEAFGQRFVAVKNRLLFSKKWRTFHDFLGDYIKKTMGPEWGNAELAKPFEQRHPILVWYHHVCMHQQRYAKGTDELYSMPMTGAVSAYVHLAYDLYTLDHNVELQKKLVGRLRNHDNFYGARYEVFVAATLIRAGFKIEFENEDDRSTSHCEFTAMFGRTGKSFSVEAKHRAGNSFRPGRQLVRALAKHALHPRIIFIDINVPDDTADTDIPAHLRVALTEIRALEGSIINGQPMPDGYVVVTNTPWHHHLEAESFRCTAMADGFQIPDFKYDTPFFSLRAAIEARERHIEMHELMRSMKDHADIPTTFDGEIPEFAFGKGAPRLLVGQRYLVKDVDGAEKPALLTSATVAEAERVAYCGLSFDDGKSAIYTWTLSDDEMAAWRRHPDTFFGEVGQRNTKLKDPLDLYDFFLEAYRQTPRERLLELLAGAPDMEKLRELDQPGLASIYAERSAIAAITS
jgi:hypothetical protein